MNTKTTSETKEELIVSYEHHLRKGMSCAYRQCVENALEFSDMALVQDMSGPEALKAFSEIMAATALATFPEFFGAKQ